MKIIFFTFFLIGCNANLLNRTVGYKEFPLDNKSNIIAVLKVTEIRIPIIQLGQYQKEYKEKLKYAILVSILNSGKFSNVIWEENYSPNAQDKIVNIAIDFNAVEKTRIGYYKYYPALFFLYFPFDTKKIEGEKIFWSTFIPGFWPASGYYPLLAKSGTIEISILCKLSTNKFKKENILFSRSENYNLLFYGVYRTAEVEEKSILAIENALEELSLKIADVELEEKSLPVNKKSLNKK